MNVMVNVSLEGCTSQSWLSVTVNGVPVPVNAEGNLLSIPVDPIEGWNQVTVQTNKPVDGCYITGVETLNNGESFDSDIALAPGGANLTVAKYYEASSEPVEPQPEKPGAEFNEIVTEGAPDCDSVTVEITTVTESAGYWWNDSDEAWTLGDWFPVSEEITTRDATAEECPVQPDEGEEETPTEGEDEEQPVEEPEQPVDAEETSEEGVTVADAAPETVKPAVKLEVTPETFTAEAEPVTDTPGLAQTGGDFVLPVVLGLSMLAGGVGLLFRKVKGNEGYVFEGTEK